ncbi:Ldh family oxidoreductase [Consotaella salsifontis]|uniref:Malate/lactate/ureidoglycolate dehydrogenase, LDH2 family n=1 Tax=Consotaella salsifontis TaxID=1365950 RepID=A0A1T4TAJ6_9HYPH|nr:Ldh family oxidoreductase [Consotaella salsifontis]SKA37423.1 Malate/lactate/ureidoglycolate dehydrogenase, LDH2 family [Consotaella salsifontis]
MSTVDAEALTAFCRDLFLAADAPAEVAAVVAESLVYADLRGIESHGVVRCEIYLERIAKGMVEPRAPVVLTKDEGVTGLVDGGNQFGAYVGVKALQAVTERAKRHGICALGVCHSNHFGTAAYYVERAVRDGLAMMVMSNASQTMPAAGGVRPFLGTNPLAFGFPGDREVPFILDMATSLVARGKIIMAAKRGEDIPLGWAVDKEGRPTTDAQAALDGAVLPMGGAKGSGLSMAIDIMSGVLTGAGFGPGVRNMYLDWQNPQNVGHFFLAIDIARFVELDLFKRRIGSFIDQLKAEPRAPGVEELLYAGEVEHRLQTKRQREGIQLADKLTADLKRLGEERGVAWPA